MLGLGTFIATYGIVFDAPKTPQGQWTVAPDRAVRLEKPVQNKVVEVSRVVRHGYQRVDGHGRSNPTLVTHETQPAAGRPLKERVRVSAHDIAKSRDQKHGTRAEIDADATTYVTPTAAFRSKIERLNDRVDLTRVVTAALYPDTTRIKDLQILVAEFDRADLDAPDWDEISAGVPDYLLSKLHKAFIQRYQQDSRRKACVDEIKSVLRRANSNFWPKF